MKHAKRRRAAPQHPPRPIGPTISACLIVKDEEANLRRCLPTVRRLVDEIIVVDTGSTDGSVSVAEEHGARVVPFTWCDDFAAARNESIKHAKGDWLMWIDADEELIEETPGALRQLCQRPEQPEGYLISCRNMISESGEINSVIRQWRLFRSHLGLRFAGRIHEHLIHADGSVEAYLLFQDDVWVRHWGYMPEPALVARKRARNHQLLALALRDKPDDPFIHYNLGKQHAAAHEFVEGLPPLVRGIELWQAQGRCTHAYVGNMFALAINAAVELGDNQRAVELEALVPEEVMSPDILFQAGVAWWRWGHVEEGVRRLNRAWQDTSIRLHIEGDPASHTWRPLAALAQISLERGDPQGAHDLALQALQHAPELPNLLYALALSTASLRRYDDCVSYARQILALDVNQGYHRQARRLLFNIGQGTNNPSLTLEALSGLIEGIGESEAILARAQAHAQLGETQQQYDVLEAGCREHPADAGVRLALGKFLDGHGYLAEAAAILGAGLDQPETPRTLYANLAMVLTKQGRFEDAANALRIQQSLAATT
jgi:tetratricopeptide (TPR) repeat protein